MARRPKEAAATPKYFREIMDIGGEAGLFLKKAF
jgi:hypothetical protein